MRNRTRAAVAGTTALATLVGDWLVVADGSQQDDIDARRFVEEYQQDSRDKGFLSSLFSRADQTTVESGVPAPQPSSAPDQQQPSPWPVLTDDDVFVDPGHDGVVETGQDARSTFALDGDTGSYSVGRERIAAGFLPDPASVRTEEWVNAFDHGYAAPGDGDFAVVTGALQREDGTEVVRVGVRARDVAPEDRPPANVTFVVDVSGSMDIRGRLGLVQSSLALLANDLQDDDTISLAETIREQGQGGVHLVSVGFGLGSYDDHTMEQLADQGDGFYSHVDTFEEAERLFGTELTSTLTVVAQESRAQVVFDPTYVARYRLLGYENRAVADEDFADDSIDAGEVGAGHAVTALYEVQRVPGTTGDVVGQVDLRWRSTADGDVHEQSRPVQTASGDPALELAAAVAATAEVLRAGGQPDLGSVLADARRLADDGVAGADDLVRLVEGAQEADLAG